MSVKDPWEKTPEVDIVSLQMISQCVATHLNDMLLSYIFHSSPGKTALSRNYYKWSKTDLKFSLS